MSKKAARKPVSSATRRAKTAKVKSLKKPVEPEYTYSIVTMYDGDPGIADGQGNIAPFATLNGAQGRLKELVRGSSKHCHLVWMDPERYASKKLQWERDNPQTDEKPVEPQYVYTLVKLKGGRWGISDGCGEVAPFGGSKCEVEGTRQRLVSGEFHHNRFVWHKEEPLPPVVENAPPVAHVTVVSSEPPTWTAPVGMVLLDQAEEAYLRDRVSELSILNAKLKAECEGLKDRITHLEKLKNQFREAFKEEQAEVARLKANLDPRLSLDAELSRERGESAKWLNKYLQLCQLTGQRAEPEGLDHPSVQIVGVKFEPKEHTPNVFEQPASELTKLEEAALRLAASTVHEDDDARYIEKIVDLAASILSECHSQSK